MPQYINDGDVSLFGRKRAKDLKIHHTVKCRIGPDLVAKYIWSFDSCYQWKQFFDASRQRLVKDSKKNPFPSLIAAEKLPLDAYEVAYSVNKQKRWNIMKIARKSITSFQNAERGLRVSVCNCITQSKVKYAFDAPELKSSILGYSDMITEFHGINGNYHNEYHLNNINKTISDIYRSRPRYPIKKKPRLYRRTFPKFKTLAIGKNGESLNKGMHPIHVMFLHHSFDRSVRSLNMRRKLPTIPAYEYACAYVSRRKHKKAIKKTRKHTASGRYHRKCRCYHKCGLTKETDQVKMITKNARKRLLLWELEDELYECEREIRVGSDIEIENEFDGFNDAENDGQICSYAEASEHKRCQPTLNDFIGIWGDKRKHKNCSRNKVRTVNRSSEYDIWLHSSPSTGTVTVEEYKEEYDINNNRKETIKHIPPPSIVINLDDDCPATNIETIASRLMPYAVELFGVIPRTFLSSIPDTSDELGSLLPQLNRNLPGFVCMNEILIDSGHTTLRFIINTSDKSSESEECSVSYSLRLSTSLTRFIPSDHFVSSNVYESDAAECIACEQYSFNRPSKCNEVASTSGVIPSDSSYCAVCDSCSDDGFSLQCSHRFCRECWTSYASSMITSGIVPIKCPAFECDESLHTDHILLILPVSSHELYKRMLSNKCMLKPNWLQCSYCTNVLHVNELPIKQYLTNCECGNILCLKCKQTIHPALSCEDARRYFTAIQSNGQVNRFFNDDRNVMLKRCPFCGTFCERSDGCNHMTCVCGESFCYVCGEKWDGVVDHYECVVDVSVRVYLFDVSDADAGGISVNTLQECLDYRRRRSAQNLWDSMKKFVRVLNGDAKAAHRAVSLYATVCEMLELNAVGIYRLRRRLRHVHDVRIGKHLQMLIGCLQHFKQRFDFYLKLLLLSQDNESTKPDRISRICYSIENLLTEYLSEVL